MATVLYLLSDVFHLNLQSPLYIVPSCQLFSSSVQSRRHKLYLPASCSPDHTKVPTIQCTLLPAFLQFTLQSAPYTVPLFQLFSISIYSPPINCTLLAAVLHFTLQSPPYTVHFCQLFSISLYSRRHIIYPSFSCFPVHSTVPAIYFNFLSAVLQYTLQSPPYSVPFCQLLSSSLYSPSHIIYPSVICSPVTLQSSPYTVPSCQLFSSSLYTPRHIFYLPVSCSPLQSTVPAIYCTLLSAVLQFTLQSSLYTLIQQQLY